MLVIAALLLSAQLIAVDVNGMPPQIARVLAVAEDKHWTVSCRGHAGEEGTVRLKLPAGVTEDEVAAALGGRDQFVSAFNYFYAGKRLPSRCDHDEPVSGSSNHIDRALLFGPEEVLTRLVGLARSCGFASAVVRDFRPSDLPNQTSAMQPNWKTLDAGADAVARYGPTICFVQLHRSVLASGSYAK